jgi:FkbM family methyltransferase
MFQHQGVWFPDGEKHFPDWMNNAGEIVDGCGTYQIKKYRAALQYMDYPKLRVAVDVGAHVGLWAMQMIKNFDIVHCFEPVAQFRECLKSNLPSGYSLGDRADYLIHPYALGSAPRKVAMKIPTLAGGLDTGGTHVIGDGDIEMRTLDSFVFQDVDFLKIDAEGYEHHIIAGARETLLRCKPCVIVEQKQHIMQRNYGTAGTPAVDLLKEMGAEVRACLSGDYILTFD